MASKRILKPNGLIKQWSYTAYHEMSGTMTFPINFSTTNYCISLIGYDNSVDGNSNTLCLVSRNMGSFDYKTNGSIGSRSGYNFLVIGY